MNEYCLLMTLEEEGYNIKHDSEKSPVQSVIKNIFDK